MGNLQVSVTVAAALLCISSPGLAAVQLVPVVGGLSSPVFVGHAGDFTNRLFINEQTGIVRVLQPGSSTATVFLDIRSRVLSGGERGLLGLAFHPDYPINGRFFVYYTRAGDGAIAIAEYRVSTFDANVADPTERVLLTIPHPTHSNHNGGMLAFGPDGYLYAGVGDGGSGNDPGNNAQNVNVLLGKILRIDVGPSGGSGPPYTSPPTNPFFGSIPGRDEIFAFGLRNPWRFSFDSATAQLWVGDVGQGSREEVDTPIVNGGNYGWRVFEGTACTNNDPSLCNPAAYIFPIFEYGHSNGRCSITSGYVYRGLEGTFPWGTYIYGDFCTGEIFAWDGTSQTVVLDTTLNISSFGEDERGELYVVNLGGSVSRIVLPPPPCTYSLAPAGQDFDSAGGTGTVAVVTGKGCASATNPNAPWIHVTAITGFDNAVSTRYRVAFSVDANPSPSSRAGTITIGNVTFAISQDGTMSTAPGFPSRSRAGPTPTRR